MTDIDDLPLAEDPPSPLLPLLSLVEAQEVVAVLAAVVNGYQPDVETARWLLKNLAARVPFDG
ncbi:hypothetical protein [Streptomyces sp. NPDC057694]|uniref:hypothetical protein n=1 Tax=Streptomyces sp. NPDC057694 TaxID=3346216 RepID=UPI0036B12A46